MLNWSNTRVIARLKQTKPRRTESELLLRKRQQGKGHTYSALAEYCVVLLGSTITPKFFMALITLFVSFVSSFSSRGFFKTCMYLISCSHYYPLMMSQKIRLSKLQNSTLL